MTKKRIKVPLSPPSKGQLKPKYNRAVEKYWEEYNDVMVPEGYMLVNQLINCLLYTSPSPRDS